MNIIQKLGDKIKKIRKSSGNMLPKLSISEMSSLLAIAPDGKHYYKEEEFLHGLETERMRLSTRSFLVVVYVHEFDMDGLTEYLYLIESYDSLSQAKQAASELNIELKKSELKKTEDENLGRILKSEGNFRLLPFSFNDKGISILDKYAFMTGDKYDNFHNKHTTILVVGPFDGFVVDAQLINLFKNKSDVNNYFTYVGEALLKNKTPPNPYNGTFI